MRVQFGDATVHVTFGGSIVCIVQVLRRILLNVNFPLIYLGFMMNKIKKAKRDRLQCVQRRSTKNLCLFKRVNNTEKCNLEEKQRFTDTQVPDTECMLNTHSTKKAYNENFNITCMNFLHDNKCKHLEESFGNKYLDTRHETYDLKEKAFEDATIPDIRFSTIHQRNHSDEDYGFGFFKDIAEPSTCDLLSSSKFLEEEDVIFDRVSKGDDVTLLFDCKEPATIKQNQAEFFGFPSTYCPVSPINLDNSNSDLLQVPDYENQLNRYKEQLSSENCSVFYQPDKQFCPVMEIEE